MKEMCYVNNGDPLCP